MWNRILSIFSIKDKVKITYQHKVLGELVFDADDCTWETVDNPIYHGGIPGTESLPDEKQIIDIFSKLENIDKYWSICSDDLSNIIYSYTSIPKEKTLKEIFKISALSLYDDYWEVCFETRSEYKWLYMSMQFEGDNYVSNTIDT